MEKITINGTEFKKAPVSKYMAELAKRFNLDVDAFIEPNWDGYGKNRKVYRFHGGFLASFEALSREVSDWSTDPSWGQGFLVRE